jgi:5-methyltetrahydrofolate--homocysteine methyltransferase
MDHINEIRNSLINRDDAGIVRLIEDALQAGILPEVIVDQAMIPGMDEVGRRFKNQEIFVPEVLFSARVMHVGMNTLKPLLSDTEAEGVGTFLIGTVKGDLHDIGKNLVAMMMEGAGFRVIDLGVDVPTEKFISAIEQHHPNILGLSALLTTTIPQMDVVINELKQAGLREDLIILVGGAPVTQEYADEVGADGYAFDAASAVDKARELYGMRS